MRIVMLTRRAWPEIGGVEKHIYEVGEALKRKGYEISVISAKDIKYPQVKFLGVLFIWLWMFKNIRLFARADIVHAHDVAIWYLPLRFLLFTKPFYVTFHGWEGKFPIPKIYIWLRKISAKIAWGNICVGRYIEKWYGIKADYIIYGAVHEKFKYQISKIKNTYQNPKIILFLGRLQKDTGLPIYLNALKFIKRGHLDIKVFFLGDGLLKNEAEKYGRVLGFKKDILPWLRTSRFVFTSGYLSALEAMAAGKLVFATYNNPIKKDILEMSPFSKYAVVEKDPEKIARKIEYFLRNQKAAREIASKALNWARSQTWEHIVQTYLKLWRLEQ